MLLHDLPARLRAAGLTVVEEPGWRSRSAGPMSPVGVMLHHTAGRDSRRLIIDRNLSQIYIPKSGVVHCCAAGRSHHAGIGVADVLARARHRQAPAGDARTVYGISGGRGDTNGNPHFWGIEVENLGDGRDPYPLRQLHATWVTSAVLLHMAGRPAECAIHHREWTSRKVDMSYRGDARHAIGLHLLTLAGPAPASPSRPAQEVPMGLVALYPRPGTETASARRAHFRLRPATRDIVCVWGARLAGDQARWGYRVRPIATGHDLVGIALEDRDRAGNPIARPENLLVFAATGQVWPIPIR